MDPAVLNRFQNFQLGAKQDGGLQLELEDAQVSTESVNKA